MKCYRCRQEKTCWQTSCIVCRAKRQLSRMKHIQTEREYQARRWAERCVVHSKLSDRKADRTFQEDDYIQASRLRFLRTLQNNKCIYCNIEFQTTNRQKKGGLTIERLHSDLPHLTTNCVLCCFPCNCKSYYTRFPVIQHTFRELLQRHTNKQQVNA